MYRSHEVKPESPLYPVQDVSRITLKHARRAYDMDARLEDPAKLRPYPMTCEGDLVIYTGDQLFHYNPPGDKPKYYSNASGVEARASLSGMIMDERWIPFEKRSGDDADQRAFKKAFDYMNENKYASSLSFWNRFRFFGPSLKNHDSGRATTVADEPVALQVGQMSVPHYYEGEIQAGDLLLISLPNPGKQQVFSQNASGRRAMQTCKKLEYAPLTRRHRLLHVSDMVTKFLYQYYMIITDGPDRLITGFSSTAGDLQVSDDQGLYKTWLNKLFQKDPDASHLNALPITSHFVDAMAQERWFEVGKLTVNNFFSVLDQYATVTPPESIFLLLMQTDDRDATKDCLDALHQGKLVPDEITDDRVVAILFVMVMEKFITRTSGIPGFFMGDANNGLDPDTPTGLFVRILGEELFGGKVTPASDVRGVTRARSLQTLQMISVALLFKLFYFREAGSITGKIRDTMYAVVQSVAEFMRDFAAKLQAGADVRDMKQEFFKLLGAKIYMRLIKRDDIGSEINLDTYITEINKFKADPSVDIAHKENLPNFQGYLEATLRKRPLDEEVERQLYLRKHEPLYPNHIPVAFEVLLGDGYKGRDEGFQITETTLSTMEKNLWKEDLAKMMFEITNPNLVTPEVKPKLPVAEKDLTMVEFMTKYAPVLTEDVDMLHNFTDRVFSGTAVGEMQRRVGMHEKYKVVSDATGVYFFGSKITSSVNPQTGQPDTVFIKKSFKNQRAQMLHQGSKTLPLVEALTTLSDVPFENPFYRPEEIRRRFDEIALIGGKILALEATVLKKSGITAKVFSEKLGYNYVDVYNGSGLVFYAFDFQQLHDILKKYIEIPEADLKSLGAIDANNYSEGLGRFLQGLKQIFELVRSGVEYIKLEREISETISRQINHELDKQIKAYRDIMNNNIETIGANLKPTPQTDDEFDVPPPTYQSVSHLNTSEKQTMFSKPRRSSSKIPSRKNYLEAQMQMMSSVDSDPGLIPAPASEAWNMPSPTPGAPKSSPATGSIPPATPGAPKSSPATGSIPPATGSIPLPPSRKPPPTPGAPKSSPATGSIPPPPSRKPPPTPGAPKRSGGMPLLAPGGSMSSLAATPPTASLPPAKSKSGGYVVEEENDSDFMTAPSHASSSGPRVTFATPGGPTSSARAGRASYSAGVSAPPRVSSSGAAPSATSRKRVAPPTLEIKPVDGKDAFDATLLIPPQVFHRANAVFLNFLETMTKLHAGVAVRPGERNCNYEIAHTPRINSIVCD